MLPEPLDWRLRPYFLAVGGAMTVHYRITVTAVGTRHITIGWVLREASRELQIHLISASGCICAAGRLWVVHRSAGGKDTGGPSEPGDRALPQRHRAPPQPV